MQSKASFYVLENTSSVGATPPPLVPRPRGVVFGGDGGHTCFASIFLGLNFKTILFCLGMALKVVGDAGGRNKFQKKTSSPLLFQYKEHIFFIFIVSCVCEVIARINIYTHTYICLQTHRLL